MRPGLGALFCHHGLQLTAPDLLANAPNVVLYVCRRDGPPAPKKGPAMKMFSVPYRAFGIGLKDDSKVYSALVKADSASMAACLCVRAYPFAIVWGYPVAAVMA
jgi:hypothetical protein